MTWEERAVAFACGTEWLIGVIGVPDTPSSRGVLVVVGGPQYRVGSHRQFTLLCRAVTAQGTPTMRFDYRGMGDSGGAARTFEEIQHDIQAAINQFFSQMPELREVVLWGLCDAASASLLYAHQDRRVKGLVLLNPWVRTAEGLAKTQLKHYYWSRIKDRHFWQKLVRGEFVATAALRSFANAVRTAFGPRFNPPTPDATGQRADIPQSNDHLPLPERMADGLSRFKGKVLLILSGNDITAQEFEETLQNSRRWRQLIASPQIESRKLPEANHTFSRAAWRNQVENWTMTWVKSW